MLKFNEWCQFWEGQEAFATTMYHGTGIKQAINIIHDKQGIKPYRPRTTSGLGNFGVYLTPNISLAARYAFGGLSAGEIGRTPAILEVKIFKASRHYKMQSDPLDRADNAWRNHYENDGLEDREPIRIIEDDAEEIIKKILKTYKINPGYLHVSLNAHDLEGLQGFDLFDYIRRYVMRYIGEEFYRYRNNINTVIVNAFRNKNYEGMIEVTNSGTLRLTPDFWEKQHQVIYPKVVPHMAVKYIWVKKKDFPNVKGEEKVFGEELLPSEVVEELESKKDEIENCSRDLKQALKWFNQDDIVEDLEKEAEDIKQILDGEDELIDLVDTIVQSAINGEDYHEEWEEFERLTYQTSADMVYDTGPGHTEIRNKTTWVRVDVSSPEIQKLKIDPLTKPE